MHIHVSTRRRNCMRLTAAVLVTMASTHAAAADSPRAAFASENDAAMAKMMSGMNIKSFGDIDRDFAAMMIAHHQGAIDMAQAELRYGKNEQLRRLAQEIIVEQTQEIVVMRTVLDRSPPARAPVPTVTEPPAPPPSIRHSTHFPHAN